MALQPDERLTRLEYSDFNQPGAIPVFGHSDHEGASSLTWEQAVRVLRKHQWFLIASVAGLTLAAAALALSMRDAYRPTARVEIDPLGGGFTTLQEIESARSEADQDYLDTQVQILQSDGLAVRVIRALNLYDDPELGGNKGQAEKREPNSSAGMPAVPGTGGSFLKEQLDLATTTPAEAAALGAFRSKLSVNPVRGSRLVEVSFTSHDPKRAQTVTNALVTQFIDQNYRNHYVTTMEASQWLSSQLSDLRQRVAESNEAVAGYQKRFGLVESDEKDVPLGQLMAEVSRQMSDAQADRIQAEAAVKMLDAGQADAVPALRDDVVYQNLQTKYADARGQLAQAETVYGDDNINVKKLKSETDELAAQVEAERGRLIKRVQSTYLTAKAREQMMLQVHEKLHTQMGDASSHLVEYQMLKNEALASAGLYNTLQARLQEAGIYAGLRSGNIRVVDMAPLLLRPTGPHRVLIVSVGFALSVMLALMCTFVWESFDNTVRIPDDIRNWTRLPSLAVVPKIRENGAADRRLVADVTFSGQGKPRESSRPKLFWSRVQSAEAEAIRMLRFALIKQRQARGSMVILVSSPSAGEGKTTVAVNLASVLAQHGKTCLIEGDLRRPMIESALSLHPRAGLGEVLAGKQTISDALIAADSVPGLTVLPMKEAPSSPADLLASDNMRMAVASLRQSFEYVVIDSPPMLSFADARTLALLSDGVVLVIRYGRTTRRAITRSAQLLEDLQAPVLGVVLNDMDLASADYHYFNYGYSWAMSGHKYEQIYQPFVAPAQAEQSKPEKSRGAHA